MRKAGPGDRGDRKSREAFTRNTLLKGSGAA
jgi:hypothetical protein